MQEACLTESHSSEEVTGLLFEDRLTSRTEPEQCNLLADRSSVTILTPEQTCPGSRRKRRVSEMGTEEEADRATDEIVNLVEQEVQYPASQPTGTRLYPDRHISTQQIAMDTVERLEHGGTEEEAVSEWVITESRAMSREVTPPAQYFSGTRGNDKMATVGRRQSLAHCAISTVRQALNGRNWSHYSHIVLSDSLLRPTYSDKLY